MDEHVRVIADRLVPIIIGRGGSTIKQIISDSNADVNLDRTTFKLTVRGRTADVASAVAMIDKLTAGQQEKELRVTARQVPLLIGRGGANIKELQKGSSATIDIRKDDNVVRVRGTAEAVDAAVAKIHELLAANGAPMPGATGAAAAAPAAEGSDDAKKAAPAAEKAAKASPASSPPGLKRPPKAKD